MSRPLGLLALLALTATLWSPAQASAQDAGRTTYWLYAANESSDIVSLVRFDGTSAVEERAIEVGYHPTDIDGAHGLTVSPDGQHWYVSFAHGQPFGQVWKMETGTDELVDSVTAGLFPATMALTPDGSTLLVANFNLHGDAEASTVSAVFTPLMAQVERIETCVRPHGGWMSADGKSHYSGCLLSDQIVEISTQDLRVTRRLRLTSGREGLTSDAPSTVVPAEGACRPSWVVVSPDDHSLYVTCNGRGEVLEIDRASFAVTRRFSTGAGPYNAAVTPDGSRLLVTLRGAGGLAVIDLERGTEQRVPTSRSFTHGVVVSPDQRYAFVSNEAVGGTKGTVDVVDLAATTVVATVELHSQTGGVSFWKAEPFGR